MAVSRVATVRNRSAPAADHRCMSAIVSVRSAGLHGITALPITVEAHLGNGLPAFHVVGLTDRAIQEARERVRVALAAVGRSLPARRITVNLAPAEMPKEGTAYDLPVALAVLEADGADLGLAGIAAVGELGLDATLRPVIGVLPMARALRAAGIGVLIVPAANAAEARLVAGLRVVGLPDLGSCLCWLQGDRTGDGYPGCADPVAADDGGAGDLAHIRGQPMARRAVEIAAAGGHNLLMLGPPGSGKTLLARCTAGLLPDLSGDEAIDVASLYSLRGAFRDRPLGSLRPPFRAPHHSISRAGLVGGGTGVASPGELSLAHHGVLFLDELCEFSRAHLEALRQPLEERRVTIGRSRGAVTLPTDFMLVAAANPCPCGFLNDPRRRCRCDDHAVDLYRGRLSGPLRDRIDIHVEVPRPELASLTDPAPEEASAAVRARVAAARSLQRQRNAGLLNAALPSADVVERCLPSRPALHVLVRAGNARALSGRGFHRVLRVARTIADLDGAATVADDHVLEALAQRHDSEPVAS